MTSSVSGVCWLTGICLLLLTCLHLCQGAALWPQQDLDSQQPSDDSRQQKLHLLKEMVTELKQILYSLPDEETESILENNLPLLESDDLSVLDPGVWTDNAKRDIPDGFAAMRGKRKMEFGSPIAGPRSVKLGRGSRYRERPSSFVSVRGKRTVPRDSFDGFSSSHIMESGSKRARK